MGGSTAGLPSNVIVSAIVAFISTTIDDFAVMLIFFSKANTMENRNGAYFKVALGQTLAFTIVVLISLLGLVLGVFIPAKYINLIGFIPLLVGVQKLYEGCTEKEEEDGENNAAEGSGANNNENGTATGPTDGDSHRKVAPDNSPANDVENGAGDGLELTRTSNGKKYQLAQPHSDVETYNVAPAATSAKTNSNSNSSPSHQSELGANTPATTNPNTKRIGFNNDVESGGDVVPLHESAEMRGANAGDSVAAACAAAAAGQHQGGGETGAGENAPAESGGGAEGGEEEKPESNMLADGVRWICASCMDPFVLEVMVYGLVCSSDNIAIYTSIFASVNPVQAAIVIIIFYLLLFSNIIVALMLMRCKSVAETFEKHSKYLVPLLLMGLGLYIISDSVLAYVIEGKKE